MRRPRPASARRNAEARGRRAEWLAAAWLTLKGWQILDRRARTGAGEIDLVARRAKTLAFVEVKVRPTRDQAVLALGTRQQGRLLRAGGLWRARHRRFAALQPRFDLILIVPGRLPRHIQGAFIAEGRDGLDLI